MSGDSLDDGLLIDDYDVEVPYGSEKRSKRSRGDDNSDDYDSDAAASAESDSDSEDARSTSHKKYAKAGEDGKPQQQQGGQQGSKVRAVFVASDKESTMPNDLYEQFDFMQKKLKRHTLGLSTIEVTALLETITGIRIPQNQETDKKKDGGGNDNDDANAKATVIAKRLAHQRCLVTKEGPLEETLKAATKLAITTAQKQKSKLGQLKSQNQKKGGKHTANGDNAKEVPSPSIFLFTHNANAAAEWFRQVKTAVASPKMIVAKLFARHMNVEKQAEELAMHGANLFAVVGTPGRILRLIENGSMSANRANLVIFDCIKDTKDRTVFDEPAVARDLVSCMKVLFNTPAEETAKTIWTRPKLLLF